MTIEPEAPRIEPLWREVLTKRFWFLTILGVVGILFSIVLDQHLVIGEMHLSTEDRLKSLNELWYQNWHTFAFLLRDLGFASLIALAIGVFVERASRSQQQLAAQRLLHLITQNVLHAAYAIRVPDAIIKHAITSIFAAPIVRSNLDLIYTLMDMDSSDTDVKTKYRMLRAGISYDLMNVSGQTIDHNIRLTVPFPVDPSLKSLATVHSGSIGIENLTADLIRAGDDQVKDTDYEKRYLWIRPIGPQEILHVVINYNLIKEASDNEVWTSLLSSTSLEVSVDMQCTGLEWNIDSRHSGTLRALDAPADGPRSRERVTFRAAEPLLPYHGVTLWWRPTPPAAAAAATTTAMAPATSSTPVGGAPS